MSAPRIWVTPAFIQYQELDKKVESDEVEYIRADVVAGLVNAAKEAAPFIKNAFFKNWVEQALAAMDQH
ncbi:MAG TPA: hypothetical protein PK600_05490 [Deltaproteobacteria bacterium]|nr:hypothetical protein [Deltaproteobacteria bacterium]